MTYNFKSLISFIFVVVIALLFVSCSPNKQEEDQSKFKNLNVTILLDLSDRISISENPHQFERDIAISSIIINQIKKYLKLKSRVLAEDKIKVVFYPSWNNQIGNKIASELNIDFADYDAAKKFEVFKSIDSIYISNLESLYKYAINSKNFPGSDIYSFFSYKVEDFCIINDTNFVNLLVIISDGYLYWHYNKISDGNRFSYIGPNANHVNIFRDNSNWRADFERGDYGFLRTNKDLSKLNILALEFAPDTKIPRDFEILEAYWSKWFDEMKVKSYKIVQSDLPSNTKVVVEKYLNEFFRNSLR